MTTTTICGDPRGPLSYILVNEERLVSLRIGGVDLLDHQKGIVIEGWQDKLREFALKEGFTRQWYEGAPENCQHDSFISYMRKSGILPGGPA